MRDVSSWQPSWEVETFCIRMGQEYVYTGKFPAACQGARYRPLRMILDVPSYAHKVLVFALDGPDRGLYFTVSPVNFSQRYRLVDEGVVVKNA